VEAAIQQGEQALCNSAKATVQKVRLLDPRSKLYDWVKSLNTRTRHRLLAALRGKM